jgi:hypothetical protein
MRGEEDDNERREGKKEERRETREERREKREEKDESLIILITPIRGPCTICCHLPQVLPSL